MFINLFQNIFTYPVLLIFKVRYFENSVNIHPSILPYNGEIWTMQYGGFHMQGTGSYGGLVSSPLQLLSLLSTLDMEHWYVWITYLSSFLHVALTTTPPPHPLLLKVGFFFSYLTVNG